MKSKLKSLGWVGLYLVIFFACSLALSFLLVIAVFTVAVKNGFMGNSVAIERIVTEVLEGIKAGAPLLILNGALDLIFLAGYGLWYYFREKRYHFYPDYRKVFSVKNVLSIAGIAFFGQYAINIVLTLFYMLAPGLWESYLELEENFHVENSSPWILFFTVCLIGPVVEELVFRGMIYGKLRRSFSMIPSMFISAALFGIIHMNWVQGIYAGIAGLALAYIYEKTQTIWASCLMHAIFNSSSYVVMALEKLLQNMGFPDSDIGYLLFNLAAAVLVCFLIRGFRGQPIAGRDLTVDRVESSV